MSIDLTPLVYHIRRMATAPVGNPDAELVERFARHHDEAAFTALVARHGVMVWRVCRRLLGDAHTAEDAFQATFLVLARRAGAIRRPAALTGWLYGVALRVARKARSAGWRQPRQLPEASNNPPDPAPEPATELAVRELERALDEEVEALPEVYRLPVILCCLEGQSQEEVARRLGWSPGSVKGRLERGRAQLHARLLRRGLAVSAVLAAVNTARAAAPGLPAMLAAATVKAALAGTAASEAAVLAAGMLRAASLAQLRIALILLLAAGIVGAGAIGLDLSASPPGPQAQPADQDGKVAPPAAIDAPAARQQVAADNEVSPPLTLKGHQYQVSGVAFSPDGKWIVSGGGHFDFDNPFKPGEVKVWDAATGAEVLDLKGHTAPVSAVAFSPDGKHAASASFDKTVKVWDVLAGKEVHELVGHRAARVQSVAYSRDGKRLASGGGAPGEIIIWNAITGEQELAIAHPQSVSSVAFSPDGTRLASATWERPVRIWDTSTGKEVLTLQGHTNCATRVVYSHDGKRLAAAGLDRTVRIWDTTTGGELLTFKGHTSEVFGVAFSPDGKYVASAGDDRVILVWEAATGKEVLRLPGHGRVVYRVAFSRDGKRLASASHDKTVKVWDVAGLPGMQANLDNKDGVPKQVDAAKQELDKLKGVWACVGYEKDGVEHIGKEAKKSLENEELWFQVNTVKGTWLIAERFDGRSGSARAGVVKLDPTTNPKRFDVTWESGPEKDLGKTQPAVYAVDGDKLRLCWGEVGGKDRPTALTTRKGDGRLVRLYVKNAEPPTSLRVQVLIDAKTKGIPQGAQIKQIEMTALEPVGKKELRDVKDQRTGAAVNEVNGIGVVRTANVTLVDGKVLNTELLVSIEVGQTTLRDVRYVSTLAASTNEGATTWYGYTALFEQAAAVEGKQAKPHLRVPLPARTMMTAALSADGKLLAIAPQDKTTVQLWDVATGKEHTLKGHAFSVTALAFSPDGKTLASATGSWLPDGAPGEIKLWNVATASERTALARLPSMVVALAFSPDSKTLASVSETVKLWDVQAGKEAAELPIKRANSVAFAPNGKTLAIGSGVREDNTPGLVALLDLSTLKQRRTLEGHRGMVWCVGFTPDGKTLASGDSRGTLKLWDAATAKERASVPPPADASGSFFLQSFAFPADSKTVVATMMLGLPAEERSALVLKEWDVADGKERSTYGAMREVQAKDFPLALSGDATMVGLASPVLGAPLLGPDGKLELWQRRSLTAR